MKADDAGCRERIWRELVARAPDVDVVALFSSAADGRMNAARR
jgi:hypothetical protein